MALFNGEIVPCTLLALSRYRKVLAKSLECGEASLMVCSLVDLRISIQPNPTTPCLAQLHHLPIDIARVYHRYTLI